MAISNANYREMVQDALKNLDQSGASFSDIKTYIFTNYHVKRGFANWVEHILKQMVEKGEVKKENTDYCLAKMPAGPKKSTLEVCRLRRRRRRRMGRKRSKSRRRRRRRRRRGRKSRSKSRRRRRGRKGRRRRRRRTRRRRRYGKKRRGRSRSRRRRYKRRGRKATVSVTKNKKGAVLAIKKGGKRARVQLSRKAALAASKQMKSCLR